MRINEMGLKKLQQSRKQGETFWSRFSSGLCMSPTIKTCFKDVLLTVALWWEWCCNTYTGSAIKRGNKLGRGKKVSPSFLQGAIFTLCMALANWREKVFIITKVPAVDDKAIYIQCRSTRFYLCNCSVEFWSLFHSFPGGCRRIKRKRKLQGKSWFEFIGWTFNYTQGRHVGEI